MKLLKVKPWGEDQGDHVLINEEDFNPEVHELFDSTPVGDLRLDELPVADLKAMATAKGLTFPGNVSKAKLIELINAPA